MAEQKQEKEEEKTNTNYNKQNSNNNREEKNDDGWDGVKKNHPTFNRKERRRRLAGVSVWP